MEYSEAKRIIQLLRSFGWQRSNGMESDLFRKAYWRDGVKQTRFLSTDAVFSYPANLFEWMKRIDQDAEHDFDAKGVRKMEFTKMLIETPESEKMKALHVYGNFEDTGMRIYKPVQLSRGASLSIQASYGHYCDPRKTLPKEKYSAMEMAIFLNNEWSSVEEVSKDVELIESFQEYFDGMGVYAYLPVELIEKLYQELKGDK